MINKKIKKHTDDEIALFTDDSVFDSGGEFYLNKFLNEKYYEKLFCPKDSKSKIFVLNKNRCGNGGTTGFINYAKDHDRNLIISVPNRSIVFSKENESSYIGGAYGGSESEIKKAKIRCCTWDKTDEVENINMGMEEISVDEFFSDAFRGMTRPLLVVDEYHKLVDDSNYRKVCGELTMKILTTPSNVVLMSATPDERYIQFLRNFSGKEVIVDDVEYDNTGVHKSIISLQWFERPEKCRTYDLVCDQCEKSRMRKERNYSANKLAIFFNSVQDICNIVKQMPEEFKSDIEVLCAKTELHEATVPCYSKEYDGSKQIHFMTKAYITGMDVPKKDYFWRVLFIGGNDAYYKAFSNKEVKQGLGRFRGGYLSTAFVSNGKIKSKYTYADMKAKIETLEKEIEKRKSYIGDKKYVKDHLADIVKENLDYLYYTSTVESMDGWDGYEEFEKMMSIYTEYSVNNNEIPEPKQYPRARDVAFSKYKEKRLKGIKIPYKHSAICEKFIEKYGLEEFAKASLNDINRKLKLDEIVSGDDVDSMTPDYRFDLLLGNGYYSGSYLMGVLDYLGLAPKRLNSKGKYEYNYELLEESILSEFGAFCIKDDSKESKLSSSQFLCSKLQFSVKNEDTPLINKGVSPNSTENRMFSLRVSKKVSPDGQTSKAITEYLHGIQLRSIFEITKTDIEKERFTAILDDPSLILRLKQDDKYNWMFKKGQMFDRIKQGQMMISEFYKETSSKKQYRHVKEELNKIDSLIIDIDSKITYNEFKEIYGHLCWTAYPSISNYDADNWKKFRVIFPLAQTLELPNESLKVLKLLRQMVCKYEDKDHALGSYINAEQWELRRDNEGVVLNIEQSTVNYIEALVKNLNSYTGKVRKSKDGEFNTTILWDMDRAIAFYEQHDKDGERHRALFDIKRRLSAENRVEFEKWLYANHPSKVHHWKSHKLKEKYVA